MSRFLARVNRHRAAIERDHPPRPRLTPRGAPADPQRLRNLPAIGGCEGAIPGTRPDKARIRLQERQGGVT
jgi:hypothetical protein